MAARRSGRDAVGEIAGLAVGKERRKLSKRAGLWSGFSRVSRSTSEIGWELRHRQRFRALARGRVVSSAGGGAGLGGLVVLSCTPGQPDDFLLGLESPCYVGYTVVGYALAIAATV